MHCPRGLVAYEGRCGDLQRIRFEEVAVLGCTTNYCMVLLVYVVLFDTNGAYNRWGLRIDLGGNLKIDFGATGWFPKATEVDMCSLH